MAAALNGRPLEMGSSIVEAVEARRSIPDLSALPHSFRPLLAHMLEPDPAHRPATLQGVLHYLEHPSALPAKYLPPGAPVHQTVPGLQVGAAGLTVPPQPAVPGLQMPTAAAPVQSLRPQPIPPAAAPTPAAKRSDTGRIAAVLLVLLCLATGAVYWLLPQTGLLASGTESGSPDGTSEAGGPAVAALPPLVQDTRAGFLAGFVTGPCRMAARLSSGPNAGQIETYSGDGAAFPGLAAAYEKKFGSRPSPLPRRITEAQCAAVDFVQALQGRWPDSVQTELSTDKAASGEVLEPR